jgi:xylulokinase
MGDTILGLDIGTTSTKAVLFDLTGVELAVAEQGYPLHTPQLGWAEQDPEELWQALVSVIRTITAQAGDRWRIVALALAAQSGSLLPARGDGTPLSPVITWMDGRTEALVQEWRASGIEEQIRPINGWHLYPGLCLPTIAWIRQHQSDLFAAGGHYFSVNDYLVHRLTGRFCTNPSNAGGMQLVDVSTGEWSPELCTLAGIQPDHLSPIQPSGAVVGPVTAEVSRVTGLDPETVVVNGGHDQGSTALGLGITSPGKVLLACGTAWVITGVVKAPDLRALPDSLDMNFLPLPRQGALSAQGQAPERWTTSQSLGGLGASLEWLIRQWWLGDNEGSTGEAASGTARKAAYSSLDRELEATRPGGDGLLFLPLTGGHVAPAGEQRGALLGLRLDHRRADVARAVMEGAAYELRWALKEIERAGMPVEQMWMMGGAAKSPLWPSILADVTGVPLALPQYEHWPAVGAAILAGIGAGVYATLAEAQARFVRPVRQVEPDQERMQTYDEGFAAYQQLVGR